VTSEIIHLRPVTKCTPQVHNLRSAAELNGSDGTVVMVTDDGRIQVALKVQSVPSPPL